jgi:DNA-binding GntR family transcriptional regulator
MLAARFCVSRSPIKEAVQQLVSDGIAGAIPRRGVFVNKFDDHDILSLLDITLPLSGMAGRQAAEHATNEDIKKLLDILEEQHKAAVSGDLHLYAKWDYRFHIVIVHMARNGRLEYFLKILHNQIRLVSRQMFFSPSLLKASLADHRAIVRAIRARDPQNAEKRLMEHVRRSKMRIEQRVEKRAGGLQTA